MKLSKNKLPDYIVSDFKSCFWMKLARIFPLHLHSSLSNRNSRRKITLPDTIGGYKLIKDLQDDKSYPFKIGLYKKGRRRFVGKIWEGRFKNLHYYNLINEIVASYTLSTLRERLSGKLGSDIK